MNAPVPVVGIGASAGGLDAIAELLAALPATTGMAYLVVQHLAPERPSLLVEILRKKTSLPIAEAKEGAIIHPDHVYVIPPNFVLSVHSDALHLVARPHSPHLAMPVDALFHSLATERGHNAIGVVLSGSASDGARGLRAIKEAGGITFAQDEASADFPGMPKSAVSTGCVDFVLPPREIAATLARIGEHPYIKTPANEGAPAEPVQSSQAESSEEAVFRRAFRLLRASSGVDFTHYKRSTIERRFRRRMAVRHLNDLRTYVDLLQDNAPELQALERDLLIEVTSFFRDPHGLEALTQAVLPELLERRPPKEPLRIWVPGCATGEEAYSIAITLVEFLSQRNLDIPVQMFGTDLSETAISRARSGLYLESIEAEVSSERLARFFVKQDDRYQIVRSIRELCVFARHDATRDPPFSRLDLVSCCNLLIYFDPPMQRQMLSLFHYALKPNGFLMLGPSESVTQNAGLFELMDKRLRVYRRKTVPGQRALPPFAQDQAAPTARHDAARGMDRAGMLDAERLQLEADRLMLARYAPGCVVIDEDLNVLQFRGQTAPYLQNAPGPASLNLRRLTPPGLLVALGPALQEARRSEGPARTGPVRFETDGGMREVHLHVSPLRLPDAGLRGYLVAFETAPDGDRGREDSFWAKSLERVLRPRARAADGEGGDSERERLRRELAATREYLQAATEQHEAAKEELRSAHEEVLSSNEELQSTNEELETAKEELQSANEELVTTNEELRHRNQELGASAEALRESRDYAEAIIDTAPGPLVVLDGSLHLVRANRAFYETFRTRREDTEGRFFYDLGNQQWDVPKLRGVLQQVLGPQGKLQDYEVRHNFPQIGEKLMILNARRLPGNKQRPEMILLGIEDITDRYRAQALELAGIRKDEFLAMLAHELRNPLAPIRLAADMLRSTETDNLVVKSSSEVIHRQMRQLTRLVDDLLDVSRIAEGGIALDKAPVTLGEVVERAVEVSEPLFQERHQKFTVNAEAAPVYIAGDAGRLVQAMSNLLNNASRYTPDGGEIALSTRADSEEAVITVRDSGSGIPANVLPHVFDTFFQGDKSYARRHGGLGIGLTLARRIVELHGGSIAAKSEGAGKGSEFIIRLPRLARGPQPDANTASKTSKDITPASRRILIIDDNVDAATMMQTLLTLRGHEARCTFDGQSGLDMAREFEPDVVLLDIAMPGMDGYEVVRRLHKQSDSRAKIVAVTGFGQDTEHERLMQAGFDGHFIKPVDPEALAAFIASLR